MAAHIVKLRTVFVTLFTTETFHKRVEEELARSFNAEENETRMRLRYERIRLALCPVD